MALTLKYQGQEVSRNKNQYNYKETYQGTEAEIDTFLQNLSPIGTYFQDKGYLTSIRKANAQGIFFELEINYTITYEGFNNTDQVIYGEKSAQLSVRNLQLPLEKNKKYKTNWNHYLAGLGSGLVVPDWWDSVSSVVISGDMGVGQYMWLNNISDIPTEPVSGKNWGILKDPIKPRCRIL